MPKKKIEETNVTEELLTEQSEENTDSGAEAEIAPQQPEDTDAPANNQEMEISEESIEPAVDSEPCRPSARTNRTTITVFLDHLHGRCTIQIHYLL